MKILYSLPVFLVATALGTAPVWSGVDPLDANWRLDLVGLLGEARDRETKRQVPNSLTLMLNLRGGAVVTAVGRARRFNKAGHRVTRADLVLKPSDQFEGPIEVTLYPDRWVPKDGKPIRVVGTVKGSWKQSPDGPLLSGTYDVKVGSKEVRGKLDGTIVTREPMKNVTVTAPLSALKIDDRDFPDMELNLGLLDEKIAWGRFGMTWNRWPHRWHEFEVGGLAWDPENQTIKGTAVVPARAVDVAADPDSEYRLVFDGALIGELYVTRVTAKPVRTTVLTPPREFNGGGLAVEGTAGSRPRDSGDDYCWLYEVDEKPWFVPVADHKPMAAEEHPRLLFRRADVDKVRRRARTPEGKLIVARLRKLLGHDGEKLPTQFNSTPPHNHNKSPDKQPLGTFTSFHAPGYAMLYQLTGDKKYADLAKGALELMFKGKGDRDNRYGWSRPGTHLRVGSILASVALTYDLAYEGWDPAFRKKVALSIQDYDQPVAGGDSRVTVRELMGRTGYPPASNHYGSHFGGTLLAMLAISGDAGIDQEYVDSRIAEGQWMWPQMAAYGIGEGGWYQEGPHPSRLSTNGGFVMALQALRNVLGRDYISARPNGQWATLRWVMWSTPSSAGPVFPNRGTYGDDRMYGRAPMYSHSGDFAFGFGAVEKKYLPAVLWTYRNGVERAWEEGDRRPWWIDEGERSFNAMVYPMHAVFAFVNWPLGVEPENPGTTLPLHHVDKVNDFFVSRNRWMDADDIVVTFSTGGGPWGYHRPQHRGSLKARAFGETFSLPGKFGHGKPTVHRAADDGSFTLGLNTYFFEKKRGAVAADLSGKSGAALVLLMWIEESDEKLEKSVTSHVDKERKREAEDARKREQGKKVVERPNSQMVLLEHGGGAFVVMTVDPEVLPAVKLRGDRLTVGRQAYTFDGRIIGFNGL